MIITPVVFTSSYWKRDDLIAAICLYSSDQDKLHFDTLTWLNHMQGPPGDHDVAPLLYEASNN